MLEIANNSDAALVALFLSFALVDGELHPKELEVIRQVCREHGIAPELVSEILFEHELTSDDFVSSCKLAMCKITDEDLQFKAIITLCDIAAADDLLKQNEQTFLSLASEQWKVEASPSRDGFDWDERQREIVEASSTDRLNIHAGPGMGKTAVACARVSYLIEAGVEPTNIWLLSFTRTAVQEIRNRIEYFAENSSSVLGVKVGTIDSRAWRIRCGFSDGEVEKLFGSYDASIRDVLNLIDENPHEICEFLDTLEHVIIDEAQDITGIRARLIVRILGLLPPSCGVTIFVDPAQAIYGFTTDEEDVQEEDRVNLLELFDEDERLQFVDRELSTIYRTNAPNLIELIEELRLDIYVNEDVNVEAFENRRKFIFKKSNERLKQFATKELEYFQNALVLFRRRTEVLLASSFANSGGIKHRIRMSGLPYVVKPWLGQLLSNYLETTIDKSEFIKRWELQEKTLLTADTDREEAWNLLIALGFGNRAIHVSEIRKKLARIPPDVNAVIPDLGISGPIIGTIHASKGREADEVILRLPKIHRNQSSDTVFDEESRVMFVGASRAKSKLYVGDGFVRAQFTSSSLENGRCFKTSSGSNCPSSQVEIGRRDDLDAFSFVSKKFHTEGSVIEIQQQLVNLAHKAPIKLRVRSDNKNEFRYRISTISDGVAPGLTIGYFSKALNKDLFEVLNRIEQHSSNFKPPEYIPHIYLIGVTCYAVDEDSPHLTEIHEPYASSGIWLIPVVIGFPKVVFLRRKTYGG